jgi:hypothetical protein
MSIPSASKSVPSILMPGRLYYRHWRSPGRLESRRLVVLHYIRSLSASIIRRWSTTRCEALDSIHHGKSSLRSGMNLLRG